MSRITISIPRHVTGGVYSRVVPHSSLDQEYRDSEHHIACGPLDAPEFIPTGSTQVGLIATNGRHVTHVVVSPSVTSREFT
jgi:hypothetical protein